MGYDYARNVTVMHQFENTALLWGSLTNGRFIFVAPEVFNAAPLRYRWSPQWWLSKLKRDQTNLEELVWVEDVDGRVLHLEISFSE